MNDRINLQFPFPLGVSAYNDETGSGIHVALVSKSNECGIILYDRNNGGLINKYSLTSDPIMGDLKHMCIPNIKAEEVTY